MTVTANTLSIASNGAISSGTFAAGKGGSVSISVAGQLTIDATSADLDFLTGISVSANPGSIGNAGNLTITAGALSMVNGGEILSSTLGAFDNLPASTGNAGQITVYAGTLSIANSGGIESNTFGHGKGGNISVMVDGQLTIDGMGVANTGIAADSLAGSSGDAGDVTVKVGTLSIINGGGIVSSALGPFGNLPASTGNAGQVTVAAGTLNLANGGLIASTTFGPGRGRCCLRLGRRSIDAHRNTRCSNIDWHHFGRRARQQWRRRNRCGQCRNFVSEQWGRDFEQRSRTRSLKRRAGEHGECRQRHCEGFRTTDNRRVGNSDWRRTRHDWQSR